MDDPARLALALATRGLQQGDHLRLRVNGDSMAPWLYPGDYVTISHCRPEALQRGDLVLILRENDLVTHRLIGKGARGWIVKGDGLPWADPPVQEDKLLGRAIALETGNRRASIGSGSRGIHSRLAGWLGWVEYRLWGWLRPHQSGMDSRLGTLIRLARTPFWAAYTIIAAIDRRTYVDIGHVPHSGE